MTHRTYGRAIHLSAMAVLEAHEKITEAERRAAAGAPVSIRDTPCSFAPEVSRFDNLYPTSKDRLLGSQPKRK